MNNKYLKWLFVLLVVLSLQACATSKCYNIWVREPTVSISPYKSGYYTKATFNGKNFVSSPGTIYFPVSCKSPAEFVAIEYYKDRKSRTLGNPPIKLAPLAVKSKIPSGFWKSQVRKIIFDVNEKGQGSVKFLMRLSEITIKEIETTESDSDKHQRLLDEQLWTGILKNDENAVKNALSNGANTYQPWMSPSYGSVQPLGLPNPILEHLLLSGSPRVVELLLMNNLTYPDFERGSMLFSLLTLGDWKYVGNDIAEVMLNHGANPNFGIVISDEMKQINWNQPGMPKDAKYLDRPYDRLIFIAAKKNNIPLTKSLLKHNVELKFHLAKSRLPPEWWEEGEFFLDWVKREATQEIKDLILKNQ